MTTNVKVITNGMYVSTVKHNGVEVGTVGPGNMVERSFPFPHGQGPQIYEIEERTATDEEIAAYKESQSSSTT
ncbi:hypothetical protein ELH77_18985 [Rhizobium ruizarguesonis]|uniref:hypothetical protein n=1 Tax=Rhizobium ruizarguesonis TaxID=2081791 RepID=UPI001031B1E6|nr:hypothetical protein [Rhizobium ruizarguesonis]TAZ20692.1 hypothetical protein ELH77_18985 [Rhizobium ruizarguesonis]